LFDFLPKAIINKIIITSVLIENPNKTNLLRTPSYGKILSKWLPKIAKIPKKTKAI